MIPFALCPAAAATLLHCNDHIALLVALFDIAMRLHDLLQGIDLVNDGIELTRFD